MTWNRLAFKLWFIWEWVHRSYLSSWFQACLSWISLGTEGMSSKISSLGVILWSIVARSLLLLPPPLRLEASRPPCFMPLETLPPIAVVCSAGFTVGEVCAGRAAVVCWLCRELLEPFVPNPPSRGYGPLRCSSRCLRGLVGLPSYLLYRTESENKYWPFKTQAQGPKLQTDLSHQNLLPVLSYNFQRKSTDGWQIRTLLLRMNALTSWNQFSKLLHQPYWDLCLKVRLQDHFSLKIHCC